MRTLTRLGAAAAAAVLAVGGAVVVTAEPAMAAPSIKISPAGPFKGGDKVEVTLSGFTPSAPVAVGLVPASRYPAEGPGDACASKLGCSALLVADASGGVKKTLTIVEGPIQNSKAPAETCGPKNACVIGAANINKPAETVKVNVKYVTASAPKPSPASTPTNEPTGTADPAATPTSTETCDPNDLADGQRTANACSGPGDFTIRNALLGALVVQLGLVIAVRAGRSRPHIVRAH